MSPPPSSQPDSFTAAEKLRLMALSETLAGSLPSLKLATRRAVDSGGFGRHGRRMGGIGFDFFETRLWRPGDSARMIDHKSSARNAEGKMLVRIPEWETPQSVWIWCDRSDSMRWSSRDDTQTKEDRALVLALALARLLATGRESVAHLGGMNWPAPGLAAYRRFAESLLQSPSAPSARQQKDFIPFVPPERARHGTAVLIGDFLAPVAELREGFARLRQAGLSGCLVRVIDPQERDPGSLWQGQVMLEGTEGEGARLLANGKSIMGEYRAAFAAHEAALADVANSAGWHIVTHVTAEPARTALLALASHLAAPQPTNASRQIATGQGR